MSTVEELNFIWKFLFSDITSPKSKKEKEEELYYAENIELLKKLMRTENVEFEKKYNSENIIEKIKKSKDEKYEKYKDISNKCAKNFIDFLKNAFELTCEEIQITEKIATRRNELIKQELNNKLKNLNSSYNLEYIDLNKYLGAEEFENQINASLRFNSLKDILIKLITEIKTYEHECTNLTHMNKFLEKKIFELQSYLNNVEEDTKENVQKEREKEEKEKEIETEREKEIEEEEEEEKEKKERWIERHPQNIALERFNINRV